MVVVVVVLVVGGAVVVVLVEGAVVAGAVVEGAVLEGAAALWLEPQPVRRTTLTAATRAKPGRIDRRDLPCGVGTPGAMPDCGKSRGRRGVSRHRQSKYLV